MPAKYLFGSSQAGGSVEREAANGSSMGMEGEVGDTDDNDSKHDSEPDSREPDNPDTDAQSKTVDIEPESEKTEGRVRKLVIKSDGMNFISSFKRKSLDCKESTMEICHTIEDSDDGDDYEHDTQTLPNFGETCHKDSQPGSIVIDDDEDTNEYSSEKFPQLDDEAEQATLAISSADESEDTQMGDRYCNGNSKLDSVYSDRSGKYKIQKSCFTSSEEKGVVSSVDRFSAFSNSVHDFMSEHSPSNLDVSEDNSAKRMFDETGFEGDVSDERYDTYQPITECLTDTEDNCFYSADLGNEHSSGNDDLLQHSSWDKNHLSESNTQQDSDQDVQAQMDSAINSILRLSHSASDHNSVYSYSQSNEFLQETQSNSLLSDSDNFQVSFGVQGQRSGTRGVDTESSETDGAFPHDLDAAVNSILM